MNKSIVKALYFYTITSFAHFYGIAQHTTPRSDSSEIIWHLSEPEKKLYSLVVLCEGSHTARDNPESVLRLHKKFEPLLLPRGFGLMTIEKWGVSSSGCNLKEFHAHNSRSQRIMDHKTVLDALSVQKLSNWDGTFIFIGGSEGGDVIINLLAHYAQRTRAAINFVGAGAHGVRKEIWACIQHLRTKGSLLSRLALWWQDMPKTYSGYEKQIFLMCADPSPEKWWFGQTYYYWADAFTRNIDLEHVYHCKVPLLVVMGTEDPGIASCDAFVEQAKHYNMPITYWRIEGMDHNISTRQPDIFEKSVNWLCSVAAHAASKQDAP